MKPEKRRELAESGTYDDSLWNEMCELGWPGIFIGEEYDGQDLGVVELCILQEELGYALAPSPFFSNAAAGLVIQHAGSDEQKQKWLPGMASGQDRGTVPWGGGGGVGAGGRRRGARAGGGPRSGLVCCGGRPPPRCARAGLGWRNPRPS